MKNVKMFVIVCATFLGALHVNAANNAVKPINIIIILDTSDRVSTEKDSGQVERDIKIVEQIVTQFTKFVGNRIDDASELAYRSRLDIVIPNQPAVPPIPLEIIEKLTIKDPEEHRNLPDIKADLKNQGESLLKTLPKLYEVVGQHKQTGSDIWGWFKSKAKHYLLTDYRNKVICISDGYLDFDKDIEAKRSKGTYMQVEELRNAPDWKQKIQDEGLSPIGKTFSSYNVKFLMLEITLRSEKISNVPYQKDLDIIKCYWETWLKSIGIMDTDFAETGDSVTRIVESCFK